MPSESQCICFHFLKDKTKVIVIHLVTVVKEMMSNQNVNTTVLACTD